MAEAARLLGISPRAISKRIERGELERYTTTRNGREVAAVLRKALGAPQGGPDPSGPRSDRPAEIALYRDRIEEMRAEIRWLRGMNSALISKEPTALPAHEEPRRRRLIPWYIAATAVLLAGAGGGWGWRTVAAAETETLDARGQVVEVREELVESRAEAGILAVDLRGSQSEARELENALQDAAQAREATARDLEHLRESVALERALRAIANYHYRARIILEAFGPI